MAVGVVVTLLSWRWIGPKAQFVFFDLPTLGVMIGVLSVGMLAAGLLLRRNESVTQTSEAAQK